MNKPTLALMVFVTVILMIIASGWGPASVAADLPEQNTYDEKLQVYIEKQMETYKIPGMAVAIVRDDKVSYLKGFGVANAEGDLITPDTAFLLASVSKSFTALGVMQLVENGRMQLDDPVQKYLPWFNTKDGLGKNITVAHLLYQTSGFSEMDGLNANLRPDGPDALEVGVRDLAKVTLLFAPGAGWDYSNLNYDVLGLLIQEVTGQTYESYIEEHVFAPLEMAHSYATMEGARAAGAASGYYPFFGAPVVYDEAMAYTRATLPAAGLWSSASDMSRYMIALLDGGQYGSESLLSPASMAALFEPGYMFNEEQGYAMGWTRNEGFMSHAMLEQLDSELKNYGSLQVLFHEGDWANYKSMTLLIPELSYGVTLLMNTNDVTILSVFRFFAWDVTLIATGGEAQYFPPAEEFVIQNSRWIFGLLVLVLTVALVWSVRTWQKVRKGRAITSSQLLMSAGGPFVVGAGLTGYLLLVFLPDHQVNLPFLFKFAPDLWSLMLLVVVISAVWGTGCAAAFGYRWAKQRGGDAGL